MCLDKTILQTDGYAIDGDETYFNVSCPKCDVSINYSGFNDPDERTECPSSACDAVFFIKKIWIDETTYVE